MPPEGTNSGQAGTAAPDAPGATRTQAITVASQAIEIQRDSQGESKTSMGEALRAASALLAALPQSSARLEGELLLCHAVGIARTRLLAWPESPISTADLACFRALVRRRLAGEPIAYIRERQAFWTLDLRVTADTLIPRPETELLVELTLAQIPAEAPLLVLDAGTGSGAIAAALASERPAWTLIATDRSPAAARIAGENLQKYAPANTRIIICDWLGPIAEHSLHAVVGNPPYVAHADSHLEQGDLAYEPRPALAAGPDGLEAIRILGAQAASRLQPSGLIALEHGCDQGYAVRTILAEQGFRDVRTHRDLSGHERATTALLAD